MANRRKDEPGSKLANNLLVVIIGLVASGIGIFAFLTGNQSIQDFVAVPTDTTIPLPTPTPDFANLYTFFPHPSIGSIRIYNYSYIYSRWNQDNTVLEQNTIAGSYSETVKIVNDVQNNKQVTIVGVEIADKNYLNRCPDNSYWFVYDPQRFYIVCSKDYVYETAAHMASNNEPNFVIDSQYGSEPLSLSPVYLAPFDVGKQWESDFYITIKNKVSKTISLGTFYDCFQIRFFAINYEELRYLCPKMGVVAIEVFDHSDYYSAELASVK